MTSTTTTRQTLGTSASLDPYVVTELDEADDARLRQWCIRLEHEMASHRSPFIAAEVVLRQMYEYGTTIRHPDRLYFATVFPVLRYCGPALSVEFRDIVNAAVHELLPAIFFTRAVRATPGGDASVGGRLSSGEVFQRHAYAECFLRVYQLYLANKHKITVHQRRGAVEATVMDRVVSKLDRLWLKMCFLSWRIHCRKIREKKLLFRKLALRGTAGHIVPVFIRRWRQQAHAVMLRTKVARSSALSDELEALFPVERAVKGLHERTTQEIVEKMRQLEQVTKAAEDITARFNALRALHAETTASLHAHWSTWRRCVHLLFADALAGQQGRTQNEQQDGGSAYEMNITDSAALLARRARVRTDHIGPYQLQALLALHGAFATHSAATSQTMSPSIRVADAGPSVPELVRVTSWVCRPIVPPLHLIDVLNDDQGKMHLAMNFLGCLFAGGHCSLYYAARDSVPAMLSSPVLAPAAGVVFPPLQAASVGAVVGEGETVGVGREEAEMTPADCCERMVRDVEQGMEQLHNCTERNEQYLLSVRRCMMANELELIHSILGTVFHHWSVLGLPLNRAKIEAVTCGIVPEKDHAIIRALYPSVGIRSFAELVNYLTGVAEFTNWPLLSIAERLGSQYAFDLHDEALLALASEAVSQFMHDNAELISRLYTSIKDEQAPQVSWTKAINVFTSCLGLSSQEVEKALRAAGTEQERVGADEMDQLLYLASQMVDPSPFTPPEDKLAHVLLGCLPLLVAS